MRARLKTCCTCTRRCSKRTTALVPELARRLQERVAALLGKGVVSEERLVQEAAILAERADVTEELVRLDSHLDRLGELLRQNGSVGKAIDFLIQEIHREINTIASKSADLEVTNLTLRREGRDREAAGADAERGMIHIYGSGTRARARARARARIGMIWRAGAGGG